MNYARTTQVPNIVLDTLLPKLSNKELKVLLIIIRQTIGWIGTDGRRKKRDWISQKLFTTKTGLSAKSVSEAIKLLAEKNIIACTDTTNTKLKNSTDRKGKKRIYYTLSKNLVTFLPKSYVKTSLEPRKKSNNTKLTLTKREENTPNKKNKRLTDLQRYFEILSEQNQSNENNE